MATITPIKDLEFDYHKAERLNFQDPESFRKILEKHPLDRSFIDWVRDQGWIVFYNHTPGSSFTFPRVKKIVIHTGDGFRDDISRENRRTAICDVYETETNKYKRGWSVLDFSEIETILVHELIHVAVPNLSTSLSVFSLSYSPEGQIYENIITEIAKTYIPNRKFMNYIHQTIPRKMAEHLSKEKALMNLGFGQEKIREMISRSSLKHYK